MIKTIWTCKECGRDFTNKGLGFVHYPLNGEPYNLLHCNGKVYEYKLVSLDELKEYFDNLIKDYGENPPKVSCSALGLLDKIKAELFKVKRGGDREWTDDEHDNWLYLTYCHSNISELCLVSDHISDSDIMEAWIGEYQFNKRRGVNIR